MLLLEKVKNLFKGQDNNVLYSSAICSDCQKAEEFFREQSLNIKVKKIEDPSVREELKRKHGKVLVPTIILGGEKFIGFEQNKEGIKKKLGLS